MTRFHSKKNQETTIKKLKEALVKLGYDYKTTGSKQVMNFHLSVVTPSAVFILQKHIHYVRFVCLIFFITVFSLQLKHWTEEE